MLSRWTTAWPIGEAVLRRRFSVHSTSPVPTIAVPVSPSAKSTQRSPASANQPRCRPSITAAVRTAGPGGGETERRRPSLPDQVIPP